MGYKSDIEIAQETVMEPILRIAESAGIDERYVEQYGRYKAKIDYNLLKETDAPDGKLFLVTAITPTPAGEGKTTTTVGLADGMKRIGKNVVVALREPSLGPVFGVKGGAAGGGYAQVVPMEDLEKAEWLWQKRWFVCAKSPTSSLRAMSWICPSKKSWMPS